MDWLELRKHWSLFALLLFAIVTAPSRVTGEVGPGGTAGATTVVSKLTNEQVGDPGDVQKIAFDGLRLFTAAQLRSQLECDLQYQAAARPSGELARLIATLEARLLAGYQRSGCPDAKVIAQYDEQLLAIRVRVEEGQQYRAGKVEVVGPQSVDVAAIERGLTVGTPERPWKLECDGADLVETSDDEGITWKSGEPARFDVASIAAMKAAVRRALAEQGYPRAKCEVTLVPTPGSDLATARVEIENSPVPARVDGVEIVGLKRNTREELLHFVGVAEGDALNAALLDRVHTQLKQCCRFWTYRVSGVIADEKVDATSLVAPVGTILRIEVDEYTEVPPLGKPLSEVDEVLRKAGLLLSGLQTSASNSNLVFEASNLQDLSAGIKAARCTFTADGRGSFEILSTGDSKWNFDDAFLLTADSVETYDWKAQQKFVAPTPSKMFFKCVVKPTRGENGEYSISAVLAAVTSRSATASEQPCVIDMQPVALLHLAHKKTLGKRRLSIRQGELKCSDSLVELRLNAETGRLIEFRLEEPGFGKRALVVARLDQDAFEKTVSKLRADSQGFTNLYDDRHQRGSAFQYAMAEIEKQPSVKESPMMLAWCHLARRIEANPQFTELCDRWLALKGVQPGREGVAANGHQQNFRIPSTLKSDDDDWNGYIDSCLLAAPVFADRMFPRGSWPWTLARELAFSRFKDGIPDGPSEERDARMTNELLRTWSLDFGPVSALTVMTIFSDLKLHVSPLPEMLATRGTETLSIEYFLRDVRLVTAGDHGMAVVCRAVADEFGKLPAEDQGQIIQSLPATWRVPFDRFTKRRAEQPAEPVGTAIEVVLVETWQSGLSDIVAAKLRSMSAEIARKPAAKTTTK